MIDKNVFAYLSCTGFKRLSKAFPRGSQRRRTHLPLMLTPHTKIAKEILVKMEVSELLHRSQP